MFVYRRRVQFYETDAQGIVHHSNYFRYLEEARGEFLRSLCLPYSELRKKGYEVVLLSAECQFLKPLLYDQEVEVRLALFEFNRFTFSFYYELWAEDVKRATAKTRHALIKDKKLASIPKELKERLMSVFQGYNSNK
ncbi:MAG: acyl-CoA thioesterase [Aquificota bacterium]|nr:MAG: acyl-CoA thioesterase [Aquificota bacterium]